MASADHTNTESASGNIIDLPAIEMSISSLNDETQMVLHNTKDESNNTTTSLKHWQSRIPQKFIVIWLDPNIDESDDKYRESIVQLRNIANTVQVFTEVNRCIDFITTIEDGRFFFILSCNVRITVVSLINDLRQVDSIYIFRDGENKLEQNISDWRKVRGVFADISTIFDQLQQNFQHYAHDLISTNIFGLNSGLDLDELDQSFMYSVLLKEILLEMKYDEKAKTNFLQVYRAPYSHYQVNSNKIDDMKSSYDQHSPLWWYITKPSIYWTLNEALRTQDIRSIIKIGFYLKDLHQQIEKIYLTVNQTEKLTVYRGQSMSNGEFEKMKKSKGGLLSFNNFLSTTIDQKVALGFANGARDEPHLTKILFNMEIDPSISKTPFAPFKYVHDCSAPDGEILFSMHTVFRIGEMEEIENRLWNVNLIMTSDTDAQLERLTNRIREEIQGPNELHRLGNLLIKMGQFDNAEEIYYTLLEMLSNDDSNELAYIYNQLGNVLNEKGHLEKALSFLEKSLDIRRLSLQSNHSDLATSYNSIGSVYDKMGQYPKALSYYEQTLEIMEKTLPSNHLHLASSYNNMGLVYDNMGQYSQALVYYEKTLEIRERALPSNHPDLAITYNNIGLVYANMGEYSKALLFYEKMLEIRQKTLPSNHPSLASSYNYIGSIHQAMGDYSTALIYLEKTLDIQQKVLPLNHPDLGTTFHNLGWVCHSMGEYSKALSYLDRSLQIRQISLPSNHPHLATTYNTIGLIYNSIGEYSKGLAYLEKTLDIFQASLPSNHPSLADTYNNIGLIYQAMSNYSKALTYYEMTLQIRQQTLKPNHPDLAITYNNFGLIYNSMGEYSKALSFFKKTLQIQHISLPSNHPSLADTYNNIGRVQSTMNEYLDAISYYKKALKIQQEVLPFNHPSLAATYNNIGRSHAARDHYSYALQYYQDALKIQEKVLPSNHPSLADTYNNVGEMYRLTGDCAAALPYYEKTLEIQKNAFAQNNPVLATTYGNMGQAYCTMKNYKRALSYLDKTLDIQSTSLPSNHPSIASSHYHMATIMQGLHRYTEAVQHASQAVNIISQTIEHNQSQANKYQEYLIELTDMFGDEGVNKKKHCEHWTYPVLVVISSSQESPVYTILKKITNDCLMKPIQTENCYDKLRLDQNVKNLVLDVTTISVEERDRLLETVSTLDSIESIYLLGKPPVMKEERNKLFNTFYKVCMFSEDSDQLAVQLVFDMASQCRISGNQCNAAADKDTARKHLQRSMDLYDGLKKFIGETSSKKS